MKNRDIDRGWAWVVLLASACGQIITGIIGASIGILQTQFLLHFSDSSNTLISLVASIYMYLQLTLGPVSGVMCNVFGIRATMMTGGVIVSLGYFLSSFATRVEYILATYSLISGVGFGIIYTPLNIAQGHYFHNKGALANGVTISAFGIGFSVGSSLIVQIVDSHGWRFALSVLASVSLHYVVVGSVYFPIEKQNECCLRQAPGVQTKTEMVRKESCLWFLWHPYWWIMCISYGVCMFGFSIHLVHFPSYALSCGVTIGELATLMAAFGIVLSVSRALGGFFCNDSSLDLLVFLFSTQGIYGILVLLMPLLAKSFTGLMIFQVSMTFFYSASLVPIMPLCVQLFGVKKLATVFSLIMLWGGLGYLVGPVIAGVIFDMSGSYAFGFHVGGMAITSSAVLLFLIPIVKVKVPPPEGVDNRKSLLPEDQTVTIDIQADASRS